jgi:hypothetical protein
MHDAEPPSFFGQHAMSQFALHLALEVVFFADQRKVLSILFIKIKVPEIRQEMSRSKLLER